MSRIAARRQSYPVTGPGRKVISHDQTWWGPVAPRAGVLRGGWVVRDAPLVDCPSLA